jgi:hypothetical protein
MYAFVHGRTPCLVDEDFYLAIGWTFYGFINLTLVLFSKQQMNNGDAQQHYKRMFLVPFKPWNANQAGANLPAHDNSAACGK